jgi:geranylgeranyl diphosphate synthase type II
MTRRSPSSGPDVLARHATVVDEYLRTLLSQLRDAPPRLIESITYSVTAGGKRLRPALVLECYVACGGRALAGAQGTAGPAKPWDTALAAAGAIELIHTFSLVHDDLPAMDDDDLRRGRPTNHIVFGEAMAILAGDAMVTTAFALLAACAEAALVPPLVRELAVAAGPSGMIGGQVLDMEGENKSLALDELEQVHRRKTGALLMAACRMGAIAAGASAHQLDMITRYGRHLGLAFQIVDDLLDVTSTPQQLGKHTRKDAESGKNTYPGLLGIEASRAAAAGQVEAAVKAVEELGPDAEGLRAVARFVTARST